MAEKPIRLTTDEVRTVLNGRKRKKRIVIKIAEGVSGLDGACFANNGWSPTYNDRTVAENQSLEMDS